MDDEKQPWPNEETAEVLAGLTAAGAIVWGAGWFFKKLSSVVSGPGKLAEANNYHLQARNRIDQGNLASAMQLFIKAIQTDPRHAPSHDAVAWWLATHGQQLDLALSHAKRAVELVPQAAMFRDTLAEVHFARGDYPSALTDSASARDLSAGREPQILFKYHFRRGRMHELQRMFHDARIEYESAAATNAPDRPYTMAHVFAGLGNCFLAAQDFDTAVVYYRRAWPGLQWAWGYVTRFALALLKSAIPRPEEAVPLLKQAQRMSPEQGQPYSLLCLSYLLLRDTNHALHWLTLGITFYDRTQIEWMLREKAFHSIRKQMEQLLVERGKITADAAAAIAASRSDRKIFVSYAHEDRKWLEEIRRMLIPFLRNDQIEWWDDSSIRPGAKWEAEIARAINTASAALLLVSRHFLSSEFIHANEMLPLLAAAEQRGLKVLWVAVGKSLYDRTPLAGLQCANEPSEPLDSVELQRQPEVLHQTCDRIAAVLSSGNDG